jgi:GNAT superfamily N-acetyltransferase
MRSNSKLTLTWLSASQFDSLVRDEDGVKTKTQVPFVDTDDADWYQKTPERGRYLVAQWDGKLVGVQKFYQWKKYQDWIEEALIREGRNSLRGTVYNGAYIAVHPEYRRRGVATALNDALRDMLKPGDIMILGTHEPDGKALNRQWLSAQGGRINILYGKGYDTYLDYDPTKVNYVVTDEEHFGRVSPSRVAAKYVGF